MSFLKFRSVTAVLLLSIAASVFAQQNILPDPGFEAPDKNGPPADGWWVYNNRGEAHAVVDKKIVHGGRQSVRLSGTPDARFIFLSPKLEVAAEDEIAFSGWIRCDRAQETNHAGINITFRDHEGRVLDRTRVAPKEINPGQWMQLKSSAKAPTRAVVADFEVFCSNMVGSVWADDVSAVVTTPQSIFLDEGPRNWPGEHKLLVRVVNRDTSPFRGTIRVETDDSKVNVPVDVPAHATQKVQVAVKLTEPGGHAYSIRLLDTTGQRLRSIEGHFHISQALTVFPACPCYLNIAPGTAEIRVDAKIVVNPLQRAGLRLETVLRNASGKEIAKTSTAASGGEFVGTKLRVPTSQPDVYPVSVRLIDRAGNEVGSGDTDVHVHSNAESIVTTQRNGYLRVAGEAQFPIGLYSCSHYDEMSAGGFTATHSYSISLGDAADPITATDPDVKRLLDQNVRFHMRMMVELPRHAIEKAQWTQIRRRIETFRNHPGLLCWGTEERVARGEAPLKNLVALYKLVHELDPNHPIVVGDTRDIIQHLMVDRRNFFPDQAMDAGIWWWYPIPLDGADGEPLDGQEKPAQILQPPAWLTTTTSKKPLWIAMQSYQHPKKDARFPTPAEYRCMAYLSIINDVRGLWFYTGSGQKDFYGRPAGLLNKPVEGHWDYVQTLVHELRELSPVIMAPKVKAVSLATANPNIEFTTRQLDHKLYILAANKSSQRQTARFRGASLKGKSVRVLYEEHRAVIDGTELGDTFEPFGVHVYSLE
jgi:hypothetical protein